MAEIWTYFDLDSEYYHFNILILIIFLFNQSGPNFVYERKVIGHVFPASLVWLVARMYEWPYPTFVAR